MQAQICTIGICLVAALFDMLVGKKVQVVVAWQDLQEFSEMSSPLTLLVLLVIFFDLWWALEVVRNGN